MTASTIFDNTCTPLTVWLQAVWSFITIKNVISALSLQRTLVIGSWQTSWAMLHRLRSVLIRPGRELLSRRVEVAGTDISWQKPRLSGNRAKSKEALVVVAVEVMEPKGFGRCRMRISLDASGGTLRAFITDTVDPGATVITDCWNVYLGSAETDCPYDRPSLRVATAFGGEAGASLSGVHRVSSLIKRWLGSTHQDAVDAVHLAGYLDEICFRFQQVHLTQPRARVRARAVVRAVGHDLVRYRQLINRPRPRGVPPRLAGSTRHPPSMDRPRA